jgi:hypothetical protein
LCTGEPGYDGPTGLGTPNRTGAFVYTPPVPPPAPAISAINPTSGSNGGGDSVTITGTNLSGASAVSFGGTAAKSFTVNSTTQITAVSPAHAAGTVDVVVTTAGGASTTSAADQFTFAVPPAPAVSAISPTSGSTKGGTTVTITGSNFTGATAVNFGSTAAASSTVNSASQITAIAPAQAAGSVDVTVTTAGGTSSVSSADQFTYVVTSFSLAANSPTVTVSRASSGSDVMTLTSSNGYNSSVTLSVSGLPARSSASFSPNPVTPVAAPGATSTMTLTTNHKTPAGSYVLTITAKGADGTTQTTNVTLTVQ